MSKLKKLLNEIIKSVRNWRSLARETGIPADEIERVSSAFRFDR